MKKKLTALLALLTVALMLFGCAQQAQPDASATQPPVGENAAGEQAQGAFTFVDTVQWDGQYDVVVVGFGGAGAAAAKAAADEGARVLIVEKAPEGNEGGNTRYCGQLFAYGNNDYEATLAYYKQLAGNHHVPEAMLEIYAKGISVMAEKIAEEYGEDRSKFVDWTGHPLIGPMSPEYPEFEGSEKIGLWTLHEGISDARLWNMFRRQVTERTDKIDVWFESPAVGLIQDPQTKAVVGVEVQRDGKLVNVLAENGVVLATGGFENNQEMIETYLGLARFAPMGSLYNTGDGVRMAMEAGADLWHMEVYEAISTLGGASFAVPQGERAIPVGNKFTRGSVILVGNDGSRYLREDEGTRHGHIAYAGAWHNPKRPLKSFVVFNAAQYEEILAAEQLPAAVEHMLVKADTLEDLALQTGMNADTLKETVRNFDGYAKSGYDHQFKRAAESMKPIGTNAGPYYAIEIMANILNTQGGPRRNENAEVLNKEGNPIPHLYSAGELGGMTALHYQGGGNIAECIIFGEIAGKNAAAKKESLPQFKPYAPVDSNIVYMPGAMSDLEAEGESIKTNANEYLGEGQGMGGALQVKVTMDGDKIAAIEIVKHMESEGISDPALANIPGAIIEAQSTEVDVIAGATITSNAIKDAVKDALKKVQ